MSFTTRKHHYPQRPIGSLCIHCNYRPARANARWPHLATNYCSDAHKNAHLRQQLRLDMTATANAVRRLVGLPDGRGWQFTAPELRAMERRLQRALPYGPLAKMPGHTPRGRRAGRKQPPRRQPEVHIAATESPQHSGLTPHRLARSQ